MKFTNPFSNCMHSTSAVRFENSNFSNRPSAPSATNHYSQPPFSNQPHLPATGTSTRPRYVSGQIQNRNSELVNLDSQIYAKRQELAHLNEQSSALKNRLSQGSFKLANLHAQAIQNHPELTSAKSEIASLKKQLREKDEQTSSTARAAVEFVTSASDDEIAKYKAQIESLQTQLQMKNQQIANLSASPMTGYSNAVQSSMQHATDMANLSSMMNLSHAMNDLNHSAFCHHHHCD